MKKIIAGLLIAGSLLVTGCSSSGPKASELFLDNLKETLENNLAQYDRNTYYLDDEDKEILEVANAVDINKSSVKFYEVGRTIEGELSLAIRDADSGNTGFIKYTLVLDSDNFTEEFFSVDDMIYSDDITVVSREAVDPDGNTVGYKRCAESFGDREDDYLIEIEEYLKSDILAVLGDINNVMLY